MTQQAVAILLDFGANNSIPVQEDFSVYLEKVIAEHYSPKDITITGRTMEAIIENWDREEGRK